MNIFLMIRCFFITVFFAITLNLALATDWVPMSIYHMNMSTGVLNDSGPAKNPLNIIGTPSLAAGYSDGGVCFDSSDIPNDGFYISAIFDINIDGIRFECYAKPAVTQVHPEWATLSYQEGSWHLEYVLDGANNISSVQFRIRHSHLDGGDENISIPFVPDGQWHYFAGSYDPTTYEMTVTLDNTTVSKTANGNPISNYGSSNDWILFGSNLISGSNGFGLSADVDEYVISKIAPGPAILTISTEPAGIDSVTPVAGIYEYDPEEKQTVLLSAQKKIDCPDVYIFDHWEGDFDPTDIMSESNQPLTSIVMDTSREIRAVFVIETPTCGDDCNPYPLGDINGDCMIDLKDYAIICQQWFECTEPDCD